MGGRGIASQSRVSMTAESVENTKEIMYTHYSGLTNVQLG